MEASPAENREQAQGGENFGFEAAIEEPVEEPEKRKVVDSPGVVILKDKINALLCRYPELQLRSSAASMTALDNYEEKELVNILQNCINDLQQIRGVPAAELVIHILAGVVDWKLLPGYLDRCMADEELKRDVESEMMNWIGLMNTRLNIAFRFMNNAYIQIFRPDAPYYGEQESSDEELELQPYIQNVPLHAQPSGEKERPRKRARTSGQQDKSSD
jgi:hypothetical protein